MSQIKKLAVSGTRYATDETNATDIYRGILMARACFNAQMILPLIVGDAKGVDAIATNRANLWGFDPVVYVADWDKFGKGAGGRRNALMANDADALVAYPATNMESNGTRNCIEQFIKLGKPVLVVPIIVEEPQQQLSI